MQALGIVLRLDGKHLDLLNHLADLLSLDFKENALALKKSFNSKIIC